MTDERARANWEKRFGSSINPDDTGGVYYCMGFEDGIAHEKERSEKLVEALESARGWVATHAMQTYSRVAIKECEEIDVLIKDYREGK